MALTDALASTGIPGLDLIIRGGLPRRRIYLLQGTPGSGKTTMGLQFLLEGQRTGEQGLYVTLSETEEELRSVASSHGWSLDGLALHQLSTTEERLASKAQNTLFHPAEVELSETIARVLALVEKTNPSRIVFDSLSEMRLLAGDSLRYRREILALKQHFAGRKSTVLFLDDGTTEAGDLQLQSIAHGVIALERFLPAYGAARRRLEVIKLRGVNFKSGRHDFDIKESGVVVYPRLIAAEHHHSFERGPMPSGNKELDKLLGGGVERGTSTLLLGPAGSGKSSVAAQFAEGAIQRGEHVAMFSFDESVGTLFSRAAGLGIPLQKYRDEGKLTVRQVDPAELSPGEFAHLVAESVRAGATMVVVDSLNGYLMTTPDDKFLIIQMHELLSFLGQQGVSTLIVVAQHGLVGTMQAPVDVTYVADTVMLFRFFEAGGQVRKAISVLKKRTGLHESTIREFRSTPTGIQVGEPLNEFKGILTGIPDYLGASGELLSEGKA